MVSASRMTETEILSQLNTIFDGRARSETDPFNGEIEGRFFVISFRREEVARAVEEFFQSSMFVDNRNESASMVAPGENGAWRVAIRQSEVFAQPGFLQELHSIKSDIKIVDEEGLVTTDIGREPIDRAAVGVALRRASSPRRKNLGWVDIDHKGVAGEDAYVPKASEEDMAGRVEIRTALKDAGFRDVRSQDNPYKSSGKYFVATLSSESEVRRVLDDFRRITGSKSKADATIGKVGNQFVLLVADHVARDNLEFFEKLQERSQEISGSDLRTALTRRGQEGRSAILAATHDGMRNHER